MVINIGYLNKQVLIVITWCCRENALMVLIFRKALDKSASALVLLLLPLLLCTAEAVAITGCAAVLHDVTLGEEE